MGYKKNFTVNKAAYMHELHLKNQRERIKIVNHLVTFMSIYCTEIWAEGPLYLLM
jgi:hypothetical protein